LKKHNFDWSAVALERLQTAPDEETEKEESPVEARETTQAIDTPTTVISDDDDGKEEDDLSSAFGYFSLETPPKPRKMLSPTRTPKPEDHGRPPRNLQWS
jgi:hypothetical protein